MIIVLVPMVIQVVVNYDNPLIVNVRVIVVQQQGAVFLGDHSVIGRVYLVVPDYVLSGKEITKNQKEVIEVLVFVIRDDDKIIRYLPSEPYVAVRKRR